MPNNNTRPTRDNTELPPAEGSLFTTLEPKIQIEQALLGGLMRELDRYEEIAASIRSDHFSLPAHGYLWRALGENAAQHHALDLTLIERWCRKQRMGRTKKVAWESLGMAKIVAEIYKRSVGATLLDYYAAQLIEHVSRNLLMDAAQTIASGALSSDNTVDELIHRAERSLQDATDIIAGVTTNEQPIADLCHTALDRMELLMRGELTAVGEPSGFHDIDQITQGSRGGELTILAARPSLGKSALALQFADEFSQRGDVLFYSLEMSANELIERMLCAKASVDSHRLRNGSLSSDDRRRVVEAAGNLSQQNLFIVDEPLITTERILGNARRHARKRGQLSAVFIDYLQLIQPTDSKVPRVEQVSAMSRSLKLAARALDVPFIVLAQLNRQAASERPRLAHLRESGSIEQDADVVMFIHRDRPYNEPRPEEYGEDTTCPIAEFIVEKNRNGRTGLCSLIFRRACTKFESRAPERQDVFDEYNDNYARGTIEPSTATNATESQSNDESQGALFDNTNRDGGRNTSGPPF